MPHERRLMICHQQRDAFLRGTEGALRAPWFLVSLPASIKASKEEPNMRALLDGVGPGRCQKQWSGRGRRRCGASCQPLPRARSPRTGSPGPAQRLIFLSPWTTPPAHANSHQYPMFSHVGFRSKPRQGLNEVQYGTFIYPTILNLNSN